MTEKCTSILRSLDAADPTTSAAHGWFITGNWGDTIVSSFYPPNAYKKIAAGSTTAQTSSASSLHPGGLNVLLGDGSVRFVKETIASWACDQLTGNPSGAFLNTAGWWEKAPSPLVWQALSTRAGGELLGANEF